MKKKKKNEQLLLAAAKQCYKNAIFKISLKKLLAVKERKMNATKFLTEKNI